MASEVRGSSFNLKVDLLQNGHQFSFFQVMRLLRLFCQEIKGVEEESLEEKNVKIRPDLSLSFPPSDVVQIEELSTDPPRFLVTATMLGLYGASSPLPTFYTEDLMEEASEDMSVARDFIDIINHRLYLLLFRCWLKYREFLQIVERNDPKDLERLFCLLGLGEEELRENLTEAYRLLRYIGLFTQFPRSSLGLKTLLQDALGGVSVRVIPCVRRMAKIPPDQRCALGESGNLLGENSWIGEEMEDRMGKFLLEIGPLDAEDFHHLLPGNPNHRWISFLTKFYLNEPLEYELTLIIKAEEAKTVCLGSSLWSRLGWDTWVFSKEWIGEERITLPPEKI
jgi:type VI secretion system protein ImpH